MSFVIAAFTLVIFTLAVSLTAQNLAQKQNQKLIPFANVETAQQGDDTAAGESSEAVLAPEDSTAYTFATNTSGTFTDMTGSTQLLGPGLDDNAGANTPIGFDFWLLGKRYTQFNVTSNGMVGLNDGEDGVNTGPGDFPGGKIRGQLDHGR